MEFLTLHLRYSKLLREVNTSHILPFLTNGACMSYYANIDWELVIKKKKKKHLHYETEYFQKAV